MSAGIKKGFLGKCAGRDKSHDTSIEDGFWTALPGLGRIFKLLAYGDAKALANERQKIAFCRVHRHPAHRDVFAKLLAAFRERNVKGF